MKNITKNPITVICAVLVLIVSAGFTGYDIGNNESTMPIATTIVAPMLISLIACLMFQRLRFTIK
jgi:uncharacterized membrane protein